MLMLTAPTLLVASRAPVSMDTLEMDSTVSHRNANIIVIRSVYSRIWVGRPVPSVCVCVCAHAAVPSCSELYTGGGLQHNGNVEIDTDGPDGPAQPFTAYCEINGTTAYTIIRRSSVTCRVLFSRIYTIKWAPQYCNFKRSYVVVESSHVFF